MFGTFYKARKKHTLERLVQGTLLPLYNCIVTLQFKKYFHLCHFTNTQTDLVKSLAGDT